MKSNHEVVVYENTTIKEALEIIDRGTMRIAIVVNSTNEILGTLNDGDIRRGLLKGYSLSENISKIYNSEPTVCTIEDNQEIIIQKAIKNKVYQIPIIDKDNRLVGVEDLATLLTKVNRRNKVILMAGGLGTRLKALTSKIPKPLLKVGSKPILEIIIENFSNHGFKDIIISINYKGDMIKEYFQDGSKFGVNIEYIEETKRLGTAGALSLLKNQPNEPFFVMNADLLTNINFSNLLEFHSFGNSMATMCVREYDFQVPYGVIEIENNFIKSIVEKPVHRYFVNAGIYVLSSKVLNYIPENEFFDMPSLFDKLISQNHKLLSFPIHEYWLDIGRLEDFQRAQMEFQQI